MYLGALTVIVVKDTPNWHPSGISVSESILNFSLSKLSCLGNKICFLSQDYHLHLSDTLPLSQFWYAKACRPNIRKRGFPIYKTRRRAPSQASSCTHNLAYPIGVHLHRPLRLQKSSPPPCFRRSISHHDNFHIKSGCIDVPW
jgi:hypothetical protein